MTWVNELHKLKEENKKIRFETLKEALEIAKAHSGCKCHALECDAVDWIIKELESILEEETQKK